MLRNRQTLFWSLVFPIIFIVVFGLFNLDEIVPSKVGVVDRAINQSSAQITQALDEIELLEMLQRDDLDLAKQELSQGDLDFVLAIPEDFIFPATQTQKLELFSDPTNVQANQVVKGVLGTFADQTTLKSLGVEPALSIVETSVSSRNVRYIDFLTPGIIGQAVMMSAIMGIAVGISRYREQHVLKRILATPLKVRDFLVSEVASRLLLALVQTTIIIILARLLFDVQIYGNYVWLYLVSAIGNIIFLQLGFFIAGIARSASAAEGLANVITMPLLFLSGVFFAPEALPNIVRVGVDHLPLAPLITILRGISLRSENPWDHRYQLGILLIWVLITFLAAWHTFRFERESR
ncbi:MAG: ABC transporter permease [Parcubacteria group bacterium]